MRNPPVSWYEGLFLRPHHFQAADRHWSDQLATSEQWDHPHHYGLVALDFSRDALGNHQFEVRVLKARLRDGTLVALEFGDEPDRLDLREAFDRQEEVTIFVGVPKLKLGRPNVGGGETTMPGRFVPARLSIPDEVSGGNEQEVELRHLNVKLLLSTQDMSGYEVLPIARVKRASAGAARPQLDDGYIPPVVRIEAWQGLARDIVRAVYDMIGQKIEVLSDQLASRNIGLESRNPGDLDRLLMLNQLNAAHAVLSLVGFTPGVHPFTAYAELCRVAGQLSIFHNNRRVEPVPPYDHDNLHGIYKQIQLRIEELLNAVRDYEYEQRYFAGVGLGMQVSLESKWFNSDWQWYIGVNKGDLTPQECRDLLSTGQLDWKLGSSRQVEILFKQRAPGLELRPLDRHPRALPSQADWLYYEIARNDTPAWRDVQTTQTLAMRLKDSLIVNLDRLQGERQLVISNRGRNIPLQFALYAVPSRL
jgi:type VI secretion system protein ImpJ